MKHLLPWLVLLLLLTFIQTKGQDLLANGGFEDLNTCTEHQAVCSPAAWFTVQAEAGHISPKTGLHFLAFCFDNPYSPDRRTFPYSMTLCPLRPGHTYTLTLWLYPIKTAFSQLDILLTPKDPARITKTIPLPSLRLDQSDVKQTDPQGWIMFSKQLTVAEEIDFTVLGNLSRGMSPMTNPDKNKKSRDIIYAPDDISLTAGDSTGNNCLLYRENKEHLYAEHHRHTGNVFLDEVKAGPAPPQPPVIRSDTLTLSGLLFGVNEHSLTPACMDLLDSMLLKIGG